MTIESLLNSSSELSSTLSFFLAEAPARKSFFGIPPDLLLIVSMVAIFYFIVIRPTSKQEKERKDRVSKAQKGERVVLTGGICGRISSVDDKVAMVEIADRVKIKVLKKDIVDFEENALNALDRSGGKKASPKKEADAKKEDASSSAEQSK